MIDPNRKACTNRGLLLALVGLAVAAAGLIPGLDMGSGVAAQEPPPTIRFTAVARQNYTDQPRQYDLMQTLLELAPGAAVPAHRINGRALITVLSGEVTKVEEHGEAKIFKAGETYPESSGEEFDVDINSGSEPARLLITFLLAPGAQPLILNPNAAPSDAAAPTSIAVARTTVGTIPADFTLVHGTFEVPPGWVGSLHTHDGWNMITHLSGSVQNIVDGVVQPAVTFVDRPGDRHEAANISGATATAMFAAVGPTGAPPSRPLTLPASQPPAITPPSTGDGGLAAR